MTAPVPPPPPLPDDLAWRLNSILTGRLSGKPRLAQDIRALVQDAFGRVPPVPGLARVFPAEEKLPAGDVSAAPGQLVAYLDALAAEGRHSLKRAAFAEVFGIDPGLNPIGPQGWPAWERFRERYLAQSPRPDTKAEQRTMRIGDGSPLPSDRKCPDDGACHHGCTAGCFRVAWAGPLSGVFPGDTWPAEITAEHGTQDGVL